MLEYSVAASVKGAARPFPQELAGESRQDGTSAWFSMVGVSGWSWSFFSALV